MISNIQIQEHYNNLYAQMRKYIWDMNVIEILADVEIESYTAFPDIEHLETKLRQLKASVLYTVYKYKDDDLRDSIDSFIDDLEENYVPVQIIKEVKSYHESDSGI